MARKLILIMLALLIAGSTVWFVRNWAGQQNQPVQQAAVQPVKPAEPEKPKMRILVAAEKLPAGTLVNEQHMRWQTWPHDEDENVEEIYVVENKRKMEEFLGTVVRRGIDKGEPISDGRMVKPGESGFLAAVLNPGKRAVSIAVDATSGIAGFVFPGDRVDVILTHQVFSNQEGVAPRHASETILTDVRVVAMDQSTNDQEQKASVRRIATLEVSPKGAETVAVVTDLGRLSLSLRSIARNEDGRNEKGEIVQTAERGRGYTWDSDVSELISAPRHKTAPTKTVNVVRAGAATALSFK